MNKQYIGLEYILAEQIYSMAIIFNFCRESAMLSRKHKVTRK